MGIFAVFGRAGAYRPRSARRALEHAELLDQVVAAHARLVPRIPLAYRVRTVDYLTELVQLGQIYRWHANGVITRREMERAAAVQSARLEEVRASRHTPGSEPEAGVSGA